MGCADSLGPVRSAAHRLPFKVLSHNHAHAHHFNHFFLVDPLQLFAVRQLEVAEVVRGPSPSIYASAGSVHSMTLEPVAATAAMSTSSSLHFPPGARAHMLPPQLWSGGGVVELWA